MKSRGGRRAGLIDSQGDRPPDRCSPAGPAVACDRSPWEFGPSPATGARRMACPTFGSRACGLPSPWPRGQALATALVAVLLSVPATADSSSQAPRTGVPGMPEPNSASLLVSYYEGLLRE